MTVTPYLRISHLRCIASFEQPSTRDSVKPQGNLAGDGKTAEIVAGILNEYLAGQTYPELVHLMRIMLNRLTHAQDI